MNVCLYLQYFFFLGGFLIQGPNISTTQCLNMNVQNNPPIKTIKQKNQVFKLFHKTLPLLWFSRDNLKTQQ